MEIKFIADHVKIQGPTQTGNISIVFTTGEYAWDEVKNLPGLNNDPIYVAVTNAHHNQASRKQTNS